MLENLEGVVAKIGEALQHPPESARADSIPRKRGMGAGGESGVKDCYFVAVAAAEKIAGFVEGEVVPQTSATVDTEANPPLQIRGNDFIGLTYEPLFPYFANAENAFRVIDGGDAVTEGEGTGVIHMAPGFGEVDQKICKENGIEVIVPVDGQGKFTDAIYDLPWHPIAKDRHPPEIAKGNFDPPQAGGGSQAVQRGSPPARGGSKSFEGLGGGVMLSLHGLVVVPDTRIPLADIFVSDADKAQHIDAKDVAKYGLANMRILRWLKAHGKLVKDEPYKHNYPHCWRTDTPIIYRAMSSWYVAVTKFRERAVELNQEINWIPEHVKNGQMGHMLATAPDWSISRNRFWGTPIPIWRSASGKVMVPDSIAQIEAWSGKTVDDLHRPMIDAVTFEKDGEVYTRVEDVFDCWFESGSMPYAQMHYMGEKTQDAAVKKQFEENFPADFITEYVGQTRGWFNTLIMLSTALFDKPPFENCICHGVILGESVMDQNTGKMLAQKLSKKLKNYPEPKLIYDKFGADALRWVMLSASVMRGADMQIDKEGQFVRDVVRLNIKPLWSAFNFFTLYANADGIRASSRFASAIPGSPEVGSANVREIPGQARDDGPTNMLDRYILAKAKATVTKVRASMDAYDTPGATEAITGFFEVLNNWYIRRSRPRFWAEEMTADKQAAYDTLFTVLNLMCLCAAPLLPFVSEAVYRGLNGDGVSVHLQDFPEVAGIDSAEQLVKLMDWVRDICNAGSAIRNKQNIRNRQPLQSVQIISIEEMAALESFESTQGNKTDWTHFSRIVADELNVKDVVTHWGGKFEEVATHKLQVNSAVLGKRLPAKMKEILPASKKGEWKLEDGAVVVSGEALLAGEYQLSLEPKKEYAERSQPLSSNDALVILDLTITPELEAEGRARDLVRMVQQARKDGGLHVADRIVLALDVPEDFKAALATHGDFIAAQTLAVSWSEGTGSAARQLKQELDGQHFTIGLTKVA